MEALDLVVGLVVGGAIGALATRWRLRHPRPALPTAGRDASDRYQEFKAGR